MKNICMYFAKNEIYEKIRAIGEEWSDPKERPIVCLIESIVVTTTSVPVVV